MSEYENIIKTYSDFSIEEKRKVLSDEFSELALVIEKMRNDLNIPDSDPENATLKKLYTNDKSEDEYMVSLYENILALKEDIGEYLTVVVDNMYE